MMVVLVTGATLACASEQKPPAEPTLEPASTPVESRDIAEDDENPDQGIVAIDPRLVEMCHIPVPQFEFDSSALSAEATSALDALGACLTTGPAAGQAIRLVGHADPRGTDEYNMALGQRRAASVAGHLEARQVPGERMETSSRGEIDATGTDEQTWALDRKVEIFLAD
jgi:peptidoglycan-associated lipoprotein